VAAPATQSGELLTNPGFEEPYYRIATDEGGGAIATGWTAWWYNDPGPDYSVPEYEIAPISRDPYRVHSGAAAQQIFRPSTLWKAGVYQRVQVPANSTLLFSIYGHTWATFCQQVREGGQTRDECDPRNSSFGAPNPSFLKVGIDPTGGEDWASSNIIWSAEHNIHDNYEQISVQGTAQGSWVTVFAYTTFYYPAVINNVYWDDASLTVITPGSTSPSTAPAQSTPNQNPPLAGAGRVSAQPPQADGSQYHMVSAGETLDAIAYTYGVTAQSIRDLNGISGDLIMTGQRLLIHGPTTTPTQTLVPTPTPDEVTSTPQTVAEAPELPQTGQICIALFDDADQNGLHAPGEALLAGGLFNLSGISSTSYTTDGISEPHCFAALPTGDYLISVGPPQGYTLTGASEVPVTISGSSVVTLSFGAAPASAPATAEANTAPGGPEAVRSTFLVVGIVGGVILVAALGGIAAYLFASRKRAKSAQGEQSNSSDS
jgi:LysM repeat protein